MRFLLGEGVMSCKPRLSEVERSMFEKATGISEDWLKEKAETEAQCDFQVR